MSIRCYFYSLMVLGMLFTPLIAQPVVLITGASRGLGCSTAKRLAQAGYTVYAGARHHLDLESIAKQQDFENFHVVELDVTDQKSVDNAVEKILHEQGRLDILINNAGILVYGSIENISTEEAQRVFDVNFFGIMRMTQAVLPTMRAQKKGRIIQISSRSGFRPLPSLSIYAASKFALEGLSETMAALLKPWNIDISLVEPGPITTDLDYLSPYGSRLNHEQDPYRAIFTQAGLLNPYSPLAQSPEEIALLIQQIIETDTPHFRYQTTELIKKQAALRLVDITGNDSVKEWHEILFPKK